jgi:hypothetical protein
VSQPPPVVVQRLHETRRSGPDRGRGGEQDGASVLEAHQHAVLLGCQRVVLAVQVKAVTSSKLKLWMTSSPVLPR